MARTTKATPKTSSEEGSGKLISTTALVSALQGDYESQYALPAVLLAHVDGFVHVHGRDERSGQPPLVVGVITGARSGIRLALLHVHVVRSS
jgi:hypothetical protein